MTKIEFLFHLQGASFQALKFAENYVKTKLYTDFRYDITFMESSQDTNNTEFDIYDEDCGKKILDLTEKEVVEILYRKGKVPIWIDKNILNSNKKITTIHLFVRRAIFGR